MQHRMGVEIGMPLISSREMQTVEPVREPHREAVGGLDKFLAAARPARAAGLRLLRTGCPRHRRMADSKK